MNARGAATVAFRSVINLYSVLTEIAPDVTSARIIDVFRAAKDRPSFDGHPYTCDGEQVPGLPSLCAAQGVLIRLEVGAPNGFVEASDGWIDVPKVLAARETARATESYLHFVQGVEKPRSGVVDLQLAENVDPFRVVRYFHERTHFITNCGKVVDERHERQFVRIRVENHIKSPTNTTFYFPTFDNNIYRKKYL